MTKWIIGAILCIVGIVLGERKRAKQGECGSCRYCNWGECLCDIMCEDGEMWEELGGMEDGS